MAPVILPVISFLLILIAMVFSAPAAHASETADTLFHAASARKLTISATNQSISITAQDINEGDKNYYYRCSASGSCTIKESTNLYNSDVTDITVSESQEKVTVDFKVPGGMASSYSFPIPDPSNRTVKSFVGLRENEFGLSLPLRQTTSTVWEVTSGGWYIGMSTPTYPSAEMHTRMINSLEFGWQTIIGVRMRHGYNSLSLGFGVGEQRIGTNGDFYFYKDPSSYIITLRPFEEGRKDCSSSIRIFRLHMPLLYGLKFGHGRNCNLKVGPVLNFNTVGSIHNSYRIGDDTYKIKTDNIHQRPVTVDAFLSIGWDGISAYARYSPMKTFRSVSGLDFSTFSTGLVIFY